MQCYHPWLQGAGGRGPQRTLAKRVTCGGPSLGPPTQGCDVVGSRHLSPPCAPAQEEAWGMQEVRLTRSHAVQSSPALGAPSEFPRGLGVPGLGMGAQGRAGLSRLELAPSASLSGPGTQVQPTGMVTYTPRYRRRGRPRRPGSGAGPPRARALGRCAAAHPPPRAARSGSPGTGSRPRAGTWGSGRGRRRSCGERTGPEGLASGPVGLGSLTTRGAEAEQPLAFTVL